MVGVDEHRGPHGSPQGAMARGGHVAHAFPGIGHDGGASAYSSDGGDAPGGHPPLTTCQQAEEGLKITHLLFFLCLCICMCSLTSNR